MTEKEKTKDQKISKKEELISFLNEIEDELNGLLAENETRKTERKKEKEQEEIKKIEDALLKEAEDVKKKFKDFDIEKELEDETFKKLLNFGLDMETAYKVCHLEELFEKEEKEEKEEKPKRPEENGLNLSNGAPLKSGVYSMSKKDRQELAKRARMGEIIRL